jgi:hypothetical protein
MTLREEIESLLALRKHEREMYERAGIPGFDGERSIADLEYLLTYPAPGEPPGKERKC